MSATATPQEITLASQAASGGRRDAAHPVPPAGQPTAGIMPIAALPLADLLALMTAVAVTGAFGWAAVAYVTAVLILLAAGGQHRLRICLRVSDQAGRIVTAAALPVPLGWAWLAPGAAVRLALASASLILAFRAAACAALRAAHRRGLLTEAALLIGTGSQAVQVVRLLREHPELGLRVRGFLDDCVPNDQEPQVLGRLADLADVVSRHAISRVIVSLPAAGDRDLVPVLRACLPRGTDVCLVPRLHELGAAVPMACLDEVWGIPLIPLRHQRRLAIWAVVKRAFDVIAAAVLLGLAAPLLLALAVAVRLRLPGPALFRQVRVTGPGRSAEIVKLRTMGDHGDSDTRWAVPEHQVIPLGRWLRATHLDELPQLINVLRGELSLIGPRPERPYFAQRFSREISGYGDRHRVRAGLTGWAQVHGLTGDTPVTDRARFDNHYIEYWSIWLDLVILARTVTTALGRMLAGAAGAARPAAGTHAAAELPLVPPQGDRQ